MAQGREVVPFPRENQSLCAAEVQTPVKRFLALEGRKKVHKCFQLSFMENVAYAGILCLFPLLPLANTFSTSGLFNLTEQGYFLSALR